MILSKREILELIQSAGLARGVVDLSQQIQPASLDLTLGKLYKFKTPGAIDFDNSQRVLSECEEISFDSQEWAFLQPGVYKIQFNEILSLPLDMAALTILRSSVMRCGCFMHSGFWDPGYSGRGETVLHVGGEGIRLKKNAKIAQAVFFKLGQTSGEGYSGIHKNENTENFVGKI